MPDHDSSLRSSHVGRIVLALVGLGLLVHPCRVQNGSAQGYDPAQVYDTKVRRVDFIPAGTVIGDKGPPGWSHLIVKTHPRPGAGDVKALSESTFNLACMLFTTTMVNVKPERVDGQLRYMIDKVAVGVGTRVNGKDVVLTPSTQRQLGANLGFLGRQVLSGAYDKQHDVKIVARSRSMAVMDTQTTMLRGNVHRTVVLRYVFLLDETRGYLLPLVWMIDLDGQGRYSAAVGDIEWLPPNLIQQVTLHVDTNEFTLGIPSEKAFATMSLPKGYTHFPIPENLRGVAAQPQLQPSWAAALDQGLRQAVTEAAAKMRAN